MISERVKALRKQLGLNQTEFGRKLGVTRSVIINIELNKVPPKEIFIEHLCDIFYVNKTWLLSGTGEMFDQRLLKHKQADELLTLFMELNPAFQDYVLQQMDKLLEIQSNRDV